jgi:hypothetical protein
MPRLVPTRHTHPHMNCESGSPYKPSLVLPKCVFNIQVHGLFPPPKVWYRSTLLLALSAFVKDRAGCYEHRNHLSSDTYVLLNCFQVTLLKNIRQPWIDPGPTRPPLWLMHLCHPVSSTNVKSLKTHQSRLGKDPCLAAI